MKGAAKTMKALMLEGPSKLVVREIPVPEPADGEVLIQVMAAPINPSDIYFIKEAVYAEDKRAPCVAGFEGSGIVVRSGGGLMGWGLVNKKVAFTPTMASGSYGQFALAKSAECFPVDNSMSFEHACMSFVNPLTAMAMLDLAQKHKAKAVVVNAAASALGRMLNRFLPPEGIEIINIVRREEQVDILRKEGATHVLNSSEENYKEKLTELAKSLKATVGYDAIGGTATGQTLSCMPPRSIIYNYGLLSGQNITDIDTKDLLYHGKTLTGLFLKNWLDEKGTVKLLPTLYKLRKLLLKELKSEIAVECALEEGEASLKAYLANMSKGKVVIKPFSEPKPREQEIKMEEEKPQEKEEKKEEAPE